MRGFHHMPGSGGEPQTEWNALSQEEKGQWYRQGSSIREETTQPTTPAGSVPAPLALLPCYAWMRGEKGIFDQHAECGEEGGNRDGLGSRDWRDWTLGAVAALAALASDPRRALVIMCRNAESVTEGVGDRGTMGMGMGGRAARGMSCPWMTERQIGSAALLLPNPRLCCCSARAAARPLCFPGHGSATGMPHTLRRLTLASASTALASTAVRVLGSCLPKNYLPWALISCLACLVFLPACLLCPCSIFPLICARPPVTSDFHQRHSTPQITRPKKRLAVWLLGFHCRSPGIRCL